MDYAKELKELLRPLGIYDLNSGAGAEELNCIGGMMDEICEALEQGENDASPLTAGSAGLELWESLLPFAPVSLTEADRRRGVAALLQIDECSFTAAGINRTLAGCGIRAVAEETATPLTVRVTFPENRGVPAGFERLQVRIEQILPCHLAVEYVFLFCTWAELEALFSAWAELDAAAPEWDELQRMGGEEA